MTDLEKEFSEAPLQELHTLYKKETTILKRAVNAVFQKGAIERYQLTMSECKNINGKNVLNINSGNGQVAIQLAKRGANVVGMINSQDMIDAAKLNVEKEGVQDKCTFILDDFANHIFKERFHITVALAFFDHIEDAEPYIKKISSVTKEKCLMSFPTKFAFQVPLKLIWLRSLNYPEYLYTKQELKRLLSPHFRHYKIKNISAQYFCVASI